MTRDETSYAQLSENGVHFKKIAVCALMLIELFGCAFTIKVLLDKQETQNLLLRL